MNDAMNNRQCWVSYIRYDKLPAKGETPSKDVWEAPMSIYCNSAAEYDQFAAHALKSKGLGFLGSKTPKPVNAWLTTYGYDANLASLAPKTDRQSWARWGESKQVEFETPINAAPKEEDENPLIITEHAFDQLPDQSKIWPPSERQWIDPKLKELLFGQTLPPEHQHILEGAEKDEDGNPPLIRTYFICDAVLRKKITGVFDLDLPFPKLAPGAPYIEGPNGNHGNIEIRSLYKGKAQEELREVAPYLIDLTLPKWAYENDALVPEFIRDFAEIHGFKNKIERPISHLKTGVILRTTESIEGLWSKLRKITRIHAANKKWLYFRFWDPEVHLNARTLGIKRRTFAYKKVECNLSEHAIDVTNKRVVTSSSNANEHKAFISDYNAVEFSLIREGFILEKIKKSMTDSSNSSHLIQVNYDQVLERILHDSLKYSLTTINQKLSMLKLRMICGWHFEEDPQFTLLMENLTARAPDLSGAMQIMKEEIGRKIRILQNIVDLKLKRKADRSDILKAFKIVMPKELQAEDIDDKYKIGEIVRYIYGCKLYQNPIMPWIEKIYLNSQNEQLFNEKVFSIMIKKSKSLLEILSFEVQK